MNWLGFGKGQEKQTSLLAEWNKYAATSQAHGEDYAPVAKSDIELGNVPSTSSSTSMMPFLSFPSAGFARGAITQQTNTTTSAQSGSDAFAGVMRSVMTRVQTGAAGVHTTVTGSVSLMPNQRQLAMFVGMELAGVFFLVLAFTVALPVLVLAPQKFALCFTIGCMLILGGFMALRGPMQQLQHMLSKERLPFSAAYLASMFMTLYGAMVAHSYVLSVAFSAIQVLALLYYVLSYFPGGAAGARMLTSVIYSVTSQLFSRAVSAITGR
eukprot:jgi/Chlat1/757/Chrsp104S01231